MECYKFWKNVVNTNVVLQKEFAEKSGYNFIVPKTTQNILMNVGDENTKYRLTTNKIAITTIESGKKNVKAWNDNVNTIVDLNRKIMQYWLTSFMPNMSY